MEPCSADTHIQHDVSLAASTTPTKPAQPCPRVKPSPTSLLPGPPGRCQAAQVVHHRCNIFWACNSPLDGLSYMFRHFGYRGGSKVEHK